MNRVIFTELFAEFPGQAISFDHNTWQGVMTPFGGAGPFRSR